MSEQGPTVFNGRYELLRHIARGGMADVYLARDELLGREVALKVLFPEFANDPNFVERFRREAQAAANLNHPNIVGIYDWGQERGTYYIVMEHVAGRSMSDVLRSTGPLHPDRAAEIANDVAGALATAHDAGLVHRDVKLGNILVSDSGNVKVADFGIATALHGATDAGLTQHGSVMGTATYFSPEQAQGKALDGRSDLYSLGVVLYEMLAGVPPFQAETPVAVAYKHVQERPPSLSEDQGATVPQSLEAITMKLLAKNPANRYPTAEDLRNDLRRYLAGAHKLPGRAGAAAAGAASAAPTTAAPAAAAPAPSAPVDATTAQPITAAAHASNVGAAAGAPVDPHQAALAAQYQQQQGYYYEEPSNGGVWRTVFLVVSLLILVGILGYLFSAFIDALGGGDDDDPADPTAELVDVPNVIGLEVSEARADLVELGLVVELEITTNNEVPFDEVFGQNPPAGERVESGEVITLEVSSGTAEIVPNVIGETQESATGILNDKGYSVTVVTATSPTDAGQVISQDPASGAVLAPGGSIEITVSNGPEVVPIPDVEGFTVIDAFNALRDEGLNVSSTQKEEPSEEIEEGMVIRTEPAAGELLADGGQITIVVSTGFPKVVVPDLTNLFADTAIQALRQSGLDPVTVFEAVPAGSDSDGKVISQTPAAFTEAEAGTVVTIVVGEGTALPPTTTSTAPQETTTTTEAPDEQ